MKFAIKSISKIDNSYINEFLSFTDIKNLKEISKKNNNIIFNGLNIVNSSRVTNKTILNGILDISYLTTLELDISYKNYKIVNFYAKNKKNLVFELLDLTNNSIVEADIQFFADLDKKEKNILKKAFFFLKKYLTYNEKFLKNTLNIEYPNFFYGCILYTIEKYGFHKFPEEIHYIISYLEKMKDVDFTNFDNYPIKISFKDDYEKYYEKNTTIIALNLYLRHFNVEKNNDIENYCDSFGDFKEFVYNKKSSSGFFASVFDIISDTHIYMNGSIKILSDAVNIFYNEKISYDNNIDKLGESFKIKLMKTTMKSKYVGNIGDNKIFNNCTVFKIKNINTEYGPSVIVKSFDENYNIITFFINQEKFKDIDLGSKITFSGHIKDHKVHEGNKETIVNRVKLKNI